MNDATVLTWLYLPMAFVLGVAHALEPGHSKTVMASYLVAIKGRARDAVMLGLVTTITHTLVIFLLALGALLLGKAFPMDRIQHGLEITSGVIVTVMGLVLLLVRWRVWRRDRGHAHAHEQGLGHDHDHGRGHTHEMPHDHRLTFKELLSFGLSGGLVPCPAALALFILAVGQGKAFMGLWTVIVFSLGLAATLVIIGVTVCHGFALVEGRLGKGGWLNRLPVISAAVVTMFGIWMLIKAFFGEQHATPGTQPGR